MILPTLSAVLALTAVILFGTLFIGREPKSKPRQPADAGIDHDVLAVNRGHCPDCRKPGTLLQGPSGGMSTNVACKNCLAEFNVHMGFGTGAFKVDRSGHLTEGRALVFGIDRDEYRQIDRELFSGER